MIRLTKDTASDAKKDDLDEVFGENVNVHLEMLSDNAMMLIIEDETTHVHLRISHNGRSPLRTWVYEEWPMSEHPRNKEVE